MVWVAVTSTGEKSPIFIIPSGVESNEVVYLNFLKKKVLLWLEKTFSGAPITFQQDGAPAHTCKNMQEWCTANFTGFFEKRTMAALLTRSEPYAFLHSGKSEEEGVPQAPLHPVWQPWQPPLRLHGRISLLGSSNQHVVMFCTVFEPSLRLGAAILNEILCPCL